MAETVRARLLVRALPVALCAAAGAAVVLGGCAAPLDRPVTPTTPVVVQTAAPIFASDEEALAAATEAYLKYAAVLDDILSDGGAESERLEKVATGHALAADRADIAEYASHKYAMVGRTQVDSVSLQSVAAHGTDDSVQVNLYVCEDVSDVDLVDGSGESIVRPDRVPRTPFQVVLSKSAASAPMLVTQRDLWTGLNFC